MPALVVRGQVRRSAAFAAAACGLIAGAIVRRTTHTWGATKAEHREVLPGDELVGDPAIVASRAVTIDAPVGEVWSWLVQIGQNRGGMYSYDALENLLGLRIHSTDEIRPEWQSLEEGDRVVLVPPGWAALKSGYALPVALVDAPHTLVMRQSRPEHPWDAVWSFHVSALPDRRSRLLSRSRSRRHPGARGIVDLAVDALMDPVTWLMTRKMLLGIKQRAERSAPILAARSFLQRQIERDVARLQLPDPSGEAAVVSESDLDPLPDPAQRYLRWMGVVGQPRVSTFRVRFRGEIRMQPDQRWMPYDAWQYNRADPVTRLVRMRIDAAGVVPMFGTDTYVHQEGRMLGKLLGVVRVADGRGPESDLGELVTYVNDACMLAPSMLLTPNTEWRLIDDSTFEVAFTDGRNRVAATCVVDDDGQMVLFRTGDRWYSGTKPPTRTAWSTPLETWTALPDGRRVLASGSAGWHLDDGEFTYVRGAFDPTSLSFEFG
jgi:Family of unknown function (DUF6544)